MINTSLIISIVVSVSGLTIAGFSTYKAIQVAKKYAEDRIKKDHLYLNGKTGNKSSALANG